MDIQFASLWESTADQMGDHPALVSGNLVRSWNEYDDRAARLAMMLTEKGLGDNSKVGLYLHNSNEYLEAQYSVFKIKGVPVNVNTGLFGSGMGCELSVSIINSHST